VRIVLGIVFALAGGIVAMAVIALATYPNTSPLEGPAFIPAAIGAGWLWFVRFWPDKRQVAKPMVPQKRDEEEDGR